MSDKNGEIGSVTVSRTANAKSSRKVGLDREGIGMLMSILTNQYTDKHAAVLREYFCNAWDAQVAAGNTDQPVLVTLPSDMQPSLLIQDHGVGLAEADMIDIFGTYGKSTKKNDLAQTGYFGIGSKSAWTMGQQFIVTGVKEGVKTVALFSLDENGVGECDIMHSGPTDEPNGVLISLAVPDVTAMQEAAARFFETVDRGTALVDGQEPTPVFETMRQVNDSTWIRPDHEGQIYVVMGQVCYEVTPNILRLVHKALADTAQGDLAQSLSYWNETTSVYFKVPVGTVTVHPSRERLRDTNLTVDALVALVTGMSDDLTETVQAEVDAAPSMYQAALVRERAVDDLGAFKVSRKSITYRGQTMPKHVTVDLPTFVFAQKNPYSWRSKARIIQRADGHDREGARTGLVRLDINQAQRTLTVTGVKPGEEGKVSRYLKRYLEEGFTGEGEVAPEWVFVTDQPWGAFGWFAFGTETGATTMTLEEYKAALRALRTSSPRTVNEPSYTVGWSVSASRDLEDRDLLTDILSEGKPLMLFHDRSHVSGFARTVLEDSYTPVVLLATQSEEALRKRVAEAGGEITENHWRDLVRAEATKRLEGITDAEKAALGARQWLGEYKSWNGRLTTWVHTLRENLLDDWEKVNHPVLMDVLESFDLAELVAADVTDERAEELQSLATWVDGEVAVTPFEVEIPDEGKVFPLMHHVPEYYLRRDETLRQEVVNYINSKA